MRRTLLPLALILTAAISCSDAAAPSVSVKQIPGHDMLREDTSPKQSPRLLPPEVYMRTYMTLFGATKPTQAQMLAQGADKTQLFDSWNDYLASLGLPDYRIDMPRATQTNTLMLATFERLGIALCDRAVERDLMAAPPMNARQVFAFDAPAALDDAGFAERFDVLHRTFLGYPLRLAPADRAGKFFALYNDVLQRHAAKTAPKSRFAPAHAAWANVCYGLLRHPEFHFY